MTDIYSEQRVREIVRKETDDLRVGFERHEVLLEALQQDVGDLKVETHRLGILFEDLQSDVKLILEAVTDMFKVQNMLSSHEERLANLEKWQTLLKAAAKRDRPKMA